MAVDCFKFYLQGLYNTTTTTTTTSLVLPQCTRKAQLPGMQGEEVCVVDEDTAGRGERQRTWLNWI